MPACGHPEPSRQNEAWPVQLECRHRCAPGGCPAIDSRRTLGPREVFRPFLLARIEDSHAQPGLRIDDEKTVVLVIVTERAGETEVVLRRGAAKGTWKQMIEFHGSADHSFLGQAVTTAMPRLPGHTPAQLDRDVVGAHWADRSPETSCPRSLRRRAAWARINIVRSYSWMIFTRAASSSWLNP